MKYSGQNVLTKLIQLFKGEIDTKLDSTATAVSANKIAEPVNISLSGDVTGSVSFDGSADVQINTTVANKVALKSDLEGLGGPNVLNDSNIIKQEHLPDGFPYSEVAEILPSETIEIDPDAGMGYIFTPFALTLGGEYTVTWNGTEYSCVGQEYDFEGIPTVALGNVGAMTGGDMTEEPFVIINLDADIAAALGGVHGVVADLYGSASATIAISGTVITKIDATYIPDMGGTTNLVNGTREGTIRSINSAPEEIGGDYMMGVGAIAMGYLCKASGDYSFAEGVNSEASEIVAHAEGGHTTASGAYSHAEGDDTTASGAYSHAEGSGTTASGGVSHAEGSDTTASGAYSHAEGVRTTASGAYSHAEGVSTEAASDYQHVQGKFNSVDADGKYAHIVGNGTADGAAYRSNAHTLDWDGNAWFAGTVKVGGTGQDDPEAVNVLTTADMDSIVAAVIAALPTWTGGSY